MTVVLGHPIDIYGALYSDIQRSDDIYCLTKIGVGAYIEIYREHSCMGEPQMTGRFALQEEVEAFSDKVIALVCPKCGNHWRERVQRLWDDVQQRGFVERTSAAIIVLLVFLLAMNGLAIYLRNKFEKRW